MAYTPISNEEIQQGFPLDSNLLGKVKENFASHNATIVQIDTDLNTAENTIIQNTQAINDLKQQESWQVLPYTSPWNTYDINAWGHAACYKDDMGTVRLRGLVRGGTATGVMVTLPVGYRPAIQQIFTSQGQNGLVRLDINPAGQVLFNGGTAPGAAGWVSLSPIQFRAEQ